MTLKKRFLLMTGISTFLVAGVIWFGGYLANSFQMEQIKTANINNSTALLNSVVNAHVREMEAETKAITRNRDLIKNLKNPAPEIIAEAALPSYRRLNSTGTIDQMIITDKTGALLLNTPDNSASPVSNQIFDKVVQDKAVHWDFVPMDNGQAVLMYAFPLYRRGKLSGLAAFIQHHQTLVNEIGKSSSTETIVLDSKNQLLSTSNEGLGQYFTKAVALTGQADLITLINDDKHYSATVLPIKSKQQENVGTLVTLRDDTQSHTLQIRVERIALAIGILTLLISLGLLYWQISKAFVPIHKAVESMSYIASGDLTHEVECTTKNEIAEMLSGMRAMQENLRLIIQQIYQSSESLSTTASSAASASANTSQGVLKQQQDTETVASAMHQMSTSAQGVAANAVDAASATKTANTASQNGQQIVDSAISSIKTLALGIEDAALAAKNVRTESEAIGQILEVIKSIAEQTNLLALNAAIEAARAGEQGRGFAVVADEVRSLASRTQEATAEIQAMIERLQSGTERAVNTMQESQTQAETSVTKISQAGVALNSITEAVSDATTMNTEIAAASKEQGIVAEQINGNIVNISHIAEETAASASATASASDELMKLATELNSLMSQFKI